MSTNNDNEMPAKSGTNPATSAASSTAVQSTPSRTNPSRTRNNVVEEDDLLKNKSESIWNKFWLLFCKDMKLSVRRRIWFFLELMSQLLFLVAIPLLLRAVVGKPIPREKVMYNSFCTSDFDGPCEFYPILSDSDDGEVLKQYTLLYSPSNNTAIRKIMATYNDMFNEVKEFKNGEELSLMYGVLQIPTFAGVQFNDDLANRSDLGRNKTIDLIFRFPAELRYGEDTIENHLDERGDEEKEPFSWKTDKLYSSSSDIKQGPRHVNLTSGALPSYHKEGFLFLQLSVSQLIMIYKKKGDVPENPEPTDIFENKSFPFIAMRRYPHEKYGSDEVTSSMMPMMMPLLAICFILFVLMDIIANIVKEKESQLKELMKIQGLSNWMHWLAWYLKVLIIQTILLFLTVYLLTANIVEYPVLAHTAYSVLWMFWFLFICASMSFIFFVISFFSSSFKASLVVQLVCPVLYLIAQQMSTYGRDAAAISFFLGPFAALHFGVRILTRYEQRGEGVTSSYLWTPVLPEETVTVGLILIIFFLQAVLFILLAIYVEAIFPGSWGVPKKWYFLCIGKFWRKEEYATQGTGVTTSPSKGEFFDAEPSKLPTGIEIRGLKKEFHGRAVVNDVTLNMYQDQITVLLGHNGAGKTTTISMLTGMYPPTDGTAYIQGYDIRRDMDKVRASLGICAQNNILFDNLTVKEHFDFFCELRGIKGKKKTQETNKFLDLLDLRRKKDSRTKTLSGGMKRKVSVGVSMIGGAKVVMLDEPTSGMDPSARRALWDFMLTQKKGRTILLTTHFMDEADLLGDRIAIMSAGEVKCAGTPFFLKKKFGTGYRLVVEKSDSCNPQNVTQLLRKYIPNIQPSTNIGSELSYVLPEKEVKQFESILSNLEQSSKSLGIEGFGISLTTLEEVFLKVGAAQHKEEQKEKRGTKKSKTSVLPDDCKDHKPPPYYKLIGYQTYAMCYKVIFSYYRSLFLLILHIFIPMLFLMLGIIPLLIAKTGNMMKLPKLPLNLKDYDKPIILVDGMNISNGLAKEVQGVIGDAYTEANSSVEADVLDATKKYPGLVKHRYLGGLSFNKSSLENYNTEVTVYFNNDPLHTPGLLLGIAINAVYRKLLACNDCGFNFYNHPFPYNKTTEANILKGKYRKLQQNRHLSKLLATGFSFLFAFFILFVVKQRASNSKQLQFVSGAKVFVFWLVTFFWDMLIYMLAVLFVVICLVCCQLDGFSANSELGCLVVILVYSACLAIPLIYLLGYLFRNPVTAWMVGERIITHRERELLKGKLLQRRTSSSQEITDDRHRGILLPIILMIINTIRNRKEISEVAEDILRLVLPYYNIQRAVEDSYDMYMYKKSCREIKKFILKLNSTLWDLMKNHPEIKKRCGEATLDYFKWPRLGVGKPLTYSCVLGIIYFLLLLVIDYNLISKTLYLFSGNKRPKAGDDEDQEVKKEKDKILNTPKNNLFAQYTVVAKDLTKSYGFLTGRPFLAVNGVCLGVEPAECFGLLGLNGAGKTTTFKMLTGEISISGGEAWIWGKSVKNDLKSAQQYIGYCPQFDALVENMTSKENLIMYGLIRGIPKKCSKALAEKLAEDFDFKEHLDKPIKNLSGGNKRKVSAAVVMVGEPPILFMDEPTTGMDPATKRYFWNTIIAQRNSGKTIILTSHSMEECEALCTRLVIMVNGTFKCLGSVQHLKDTFADGYTLMVKLKKVSNVQQLEENVKNVTNYVQRSIPNMKLKERHDELITFYLETKSTPVSKMFGIMEKAKGDKGLNVEDYSLGQSNLEQVFLRFAEAQKEQKRK